MANDEIPYSLSYHAELRLTERKIEWAWVAMTVAEPTLRGCLKRVALGIVYHQEAAKMLNFEDISLRPRYNLRRSWAFQTPSD